MKRSIALLIGLTLAVPLASPSTAEAAAWGVCTIRGTITFSGSDALGQDGEWSISPAEMQCYGLFYGKNRILGPGSFVGSGSYTVVPSGGGGCLHQLGSGTVDYWIPTLEQDVHLTEPHTFTLAGAGTFMTPTLRGTYQIPLADGDCLIAPMTQAPFRAEVTMVRFHSTLI